MGRTDLWQFELLAGRAAEMFAVCAGKRRVVVKSACIAYRCDGFALQDLFPCQQKPLGRQIISDGISGCLFKRVHQMIPAQIEMFRKKINGDVIG